MGLLVVGFGSALRGDDGAGPGVIARLRARGVPEGVRALDGGTDSLRLPSHWRGEDVWIVDALRRGAAPGTVHRLRLPELLAIPQGHASAHELSLPESLRWLLLACPALARVRFRFWGIEPESLEAREGLSPRVAAAVEAVAAEVLEAMASGERGGIAPAS